MGLVMVVRDDTWSAEKGGNYERGVVRRSLFGKPVCKKVGFCESRVGRERFVRRGEPLGATGARPSRPRPPSRAESTTS